jgi:hypothetical protein
VYWEHGVELLGHREGEGRREDVWEVPGDGADLFREEWRLYIGGRGSTGRGDLRRERGRCRLTKGRGGRGFRRRAAACCGVLLAHLWAAGWSGAEGASNGCGEGSGSFFSFSSRSHGPGSGQERLGLDQEMFPSMATGFGQG